MFIEEYKCIHCEGITQIEIIKDTEKATEPKIEFCPFCGMSNQYPKEIEN
jgi:hypothetical protein